MRPLLGLEDVGEDRDQRGAVDDALAVAREARVLGEARPVERGGEAAEQLSLPAATIM